MARKPTYEELKEMIKDLEKEAAERMRVEEALQESDHRLKTILESIQAGIVGINAETHTIVDANPAALKLIGAPKEEIIGHVCHKYICPAEKGKCPITDLGQTIDNSERILLTATGAEVFILQTVTPIILGGKVHLLDSFIDITEKKQAEAALQETEEIYRLLIDNANNPISVYSNEGTLLLMNVTAAANLGGIPDDFVGKSIYEILPDIPDVFMKKIRQVYKIGCRIEFEHIVELPLGNRCFLSNFQPMRKRNGKIFAIEIISYDITKRKEAEKDLRETHEYLENLIS